MPVFKLFFGSSKCLAPIAPTAGVHVPGMTEIQWVWAATADTLGYWWNSVNNFATATDLGNVLTYTQTGLTEDTAYNSYLWAYNACGVSTVTTLTASTLNAQVFINCENNELSLEAILKLLLIDCIDCENTSLSMMALIKDALLVDDEGVLYLKLNAECGIRAGSSGLDQLGIRVLYGDAETVYAECDQFDSWGSILNRLVTIGDDGLYYLNVV